MSSLHTMKQTLEERVKELEEKVAAMTAGPGTDAPLRKKDWRRSFGMSAEDPHFEEMIRLGREYREVTREP